MELNNFLIGVFSSIVASLVVWLFISYLYPMWQARTNTESIDGTWHIHANDENGTIEGNLVINQTGTKIKAHLQMNRKNREFYYSGVYLSQQLLLTFHEKGRENWIIGAFLLVHQPSDKMIGKTLFWDFDDHDLRVDKYVAIKIGGIYQSKVENHKSLSDGKR